LHEGAESAAAFAELLCLALGFTPMRSHPRLRAAAARLTVLLGLAGALASLAGCGSELARGEEASAGAGPDATCAQTVMSTLGSVLQRVYEEGVTSERTLSAAHMIERDVPLREAVEAGDAAAARRAASALLHTGHMTDLDVTVAGRRLVSVGGPALAPLHGTISNLAGRKIASYLTSVWSDSGFSSEASGVAEGLVSLRAGNRSVGGTLHLADGPLPAQGSLTHGGIAYQYASFPGSAYPSGSLRIYLLKPLSAVEKLCRGSEGDTQVATLRRVAELIYEGEAGPRTLVQIRRVQHDSSLLAAVARRDPAGTREAVEALLHHHLVRLRVTTGDTLLADVGGPWVLAPVHADLRLHGHRIGSIVLSIQDDEGYLRLTHRLAGLAVLMYMKAPGAPPSAKSQLVKNSLGAGGQQSLELRSVPASGPFTYRGKSYRVFTLRAEAFPSGPLTIRVLVPQPYS
jgi:hypothetical protein